MCILRNEAAFERDWCHSRWINRNVCFSWKRNKPGENIHSKMRDHIPECETNNRTKTRIQLSQTTEYFALVVFFLVKIKWIAQKTNATLNIYLCVSTARNYKHSVREWSERTESKRIWKRTLVDEWRTHNEVKSFILSVIIDAAAATCRQLHSWMVDCSIEECRLFTSMYEWNLHLRLRSRNFLVTIRHVDTLTYWFKRKRTSDQPDLRLEHPVKSNYNSKTNFR